MPSSDLEIIEKQPLVKIWGENLGDIQDIKAYKGKFVITKGGKFFAKLFPKSKWDQIEYFHNMLVEELGVENAESSEMKARIVGGGKIEVELVNGYVECKLYGKSTIYGKYTPNQINSGAIEGKISKIFKLEEEPVLVIPDFE